MTPHENVMATVARGLKDEAVARELDMSVRTVRRHVAEYMASVGATSRFQAGAIWAVSQQAAVSRFMASLLRAAGDETRGRSSPREAP